MAKKIVLAYSGGLDTSVILKWLQLKYLCPIVTFTADIGQEEELSLVREKATSMGVQDVFIEDLQEEFVREYVENSDINLVIVDAVSDEESVISSTRIREQIKDGYIRRANFELGWIYGFNAQVVSGSGRGHELSFPTAGKNL